MPAAAVVGAAAIGAGGSALAASKNAKAMKKAAKAQEASTQQELALQREVYDKNYDLLAPYATGGRAAFDNYNALLGVGSDPATANQAFDTYRNSSGYQFRLGEGANALTANYAGRGLTQSGAAQKGMLQYGQDYASSEFGKYLGYLGQSAGMGLSAGSALAGVGSNYANSAGNIYQNQADFTGNAAIAGANNTNALISGITGGLGQAAGALGYSSYGKSGAQPGLSFSTPASAFYGYGDTGGATSFRL